MIDIWYMLIFGVIGYAFKKLDYPLAPMLLALVLGDMAENGHAPEPDHVAGLAPDLPHAAYLGRHHRGGPVLLRDAVARPVAGSGAATRARGPAPFTAREPAASMAFLAQPQFWARLLEIAFLNLLLSGDNAVVIALAVRSLPSRQRVHGMIWGTVGAVVLRLAFVAVVSLLLRLPLLRLIGGLLLVWIAVRLVQPADTEAGPGRRGTSFWEAIWIIIVADIAMSLDNVLAIAAAAHGDFALVALGIASSIPIVIGGSTLLAGLMNRHPWIIWLGGGLLGYVAGDMMLEDPLVVDGLGAFAPALEYPVPAAIGAVVAGLGWWWSRRGRAVAGPT